jgi:hypothetical protein
MRPHRRDDRDRFSVCLLNERCDQVTLSKVGIAAGDKRCLPKDTHPRFSPVAFDDTAL